MKKVHLSYLSIAVLITTISTVGFSIMWPNQTEMIISMSVLVMSVSSIGVLFVLGTSADGFLDIFQGTALEVLEPVTALGAACYLVSGSIIPLAWFGVIEIVNISNTVFIFYMITVSSTAFFLFPRTKGEEGKVIKQT